MFHKTSFRKKIIDLWLSSLSQLVRSMFLAMLTSIQISHIPSTFSSCHTLWNKANKHLACICVSALSFSAVIWSSPGALLLLVCRMSSSISWHVISPVLICRWCLCLLMTDHVSYGSSLFRIVRKCSTHLGNWCFDKCAKILVPNYCRATKMCTCDFILLICYLLYCTDFSHGCCFLCLFYLYAAN